jgi:hypothetical protein
MSSIDEDNNKEISEKELETTLEKIKNDKLQYKKLVDNLKDAINS